ncbi:MAG: ATP-binding protein [Planctomycetaceae bacterium]
METARGQREVLLVVGGAWLGVARLPRVLEAAGCRVVLLCNPRRFAARTRFVHEVVPAPRDPAGTFRALEPLLARRRFDWVILGDDYVLEEAVRAAGERRASFLPVPVEGDAPRLLLSKQAFAAAMVRHALPFPPTEAATGPAEARAAAGRIGYPVIVKPDRGFAGAGLFRAEDASPLARLEENARVVVQRFEEGKVGSTVILFDRGRPLSWMSSYKMDAYPPPFGPSCVRHYVHFPGLEARLQALGALLGMTGLCGVDWIHAPGAAEPLFLELNGRPTPWMHLYREFGTDLPGAIRGFLAGDPVVRPPPPSAPVPTVHLFPQHAFRAVSQGDWRGFVRGFFGRDVPNDLPRDDGKLRRAFRMHLFRRAMARIRRALTPR